MLVADWRDHDAWDRKLLDRLDAAEAALLEPAPEPELAEWPADDVPSPAPASIAQQPDGPYAPEPSSGPQL